MNNQNFLTSELIRKKREKLEHSQEELDFLVRGFASGTIPDYQISAWLMAVFFNGLNEEETFNLTRFIKNSGETLKWPKQNINDLIYVDKHSTGGVGDKVSLIVAPLCAAAGLKIPMMSGRSLGHTGGTVDKLESIPGFNMQPTSERMKELINQVGIVMTSQAPTLCPADKKLYSLRDVTATVESLPLICASIVSKKWAEGVDVILYDVKVGEGAFMNTILKARELAESLVKISKKAGLKSMALLSRMEEPLGNMIGNALEVVESEWILKNAYPTEGHKNRAKALKHLCLTQAAALYWGANRASTRDVAMKKMEELLLSGAALNKFYEMIEAQGGSRELNLPISKIKVELLSPNKGYIKNINSRTIAIAGFHLKIGRQNAEAKIDPKTGFEMLCQVGDYVEINTPLLKIHCNTHEEAQFIEKSLLEAFEFTEECVPSINNLELEFIK